MPQLVEPIPEGISYQCQRCTNCCRWPGDVVLEEDEVQKIADFLEMPLYDFVRDLTRLRGNRQGLSLIDREGSDTCIMLEGNSCKLQAVKPHQCSGFPNQWNFKNWQEKCEAKPVPLMES